MRLNNPKITVQSSSSSAAPTYDISQSVASVTFTSQKPVISRNTFGTSGQQRNKKGRFDGSLTVDFDQDYATSASLTRVLWAYHLADDPVTVTITADYDAAISATNPAWVFDVAIDNINPVDGSADDGATASLTWPMHDEPSMITTAP